MLLVNTGQDHTAHAPVVLIFRSGERIAAVNRDIVPTISKLRADLLSKLFEATVAIGDAARADDRDLQGRPSIGEAGTSAGMCD